jgi:hypothetical protein
MELQESRPAPTRKVSSFVQDILVNGVGMLFLLMNRPAAATSKTGLFARVSSMRTSIGLITTSLEQESTLPVYPKALA